MTIFSRIFFSITLLVALPCAALAQTPESNRIAVVNVQKILDDSLAAKDIKAQIEKKSKLYQAEITKQEEELKKKEQELAKQRSILSAEAFEQKVKEFRTQVGNVQRNVQQRKLELDRAGGTALAEIQKTVYDIISQMAEEKGFTVAIPTSQLLFAKKDADISDEVLKRLNAQLTKVTLPKGENKEKK